MFYETFFELGLTTWAAFEVIMFFLAIWLISTYFGLFEPSNIPPGPRSYPIVGNSLQFDVERPHETFLSWSKQYGPIYRLYAGKQLMVVINDYEMLKSALSGQMGEITAGRPFNYIFNAIQGGQPTGIVNIDGEKWKEQRRFSLGVLRNFGVGRTLMEDKIERELEILLGNIDRQISLNDPTGIDIVLALKYCVGNIITSLAFGKTFPIGDPDFDLYQKSIDSNFRLLSKAMLLNVYPILRYLTPDGCNYYKIMENAKIVRGFLRNEIKSHWEEVKNSAEITDFTHAYIKEMQIQQQKNPNSFYSDIQLEGVVGDIFVAGQETTVTTLAWGLLFFLHYPQVQEKVQKEIREKVGGVPKWSDRTQLHYTNATIAEIQRLADIAPIGLPHSITEDIQIGGFTVPKGTTILPNLHAIHYDSRYFPDPKQFRPERFLDANGNLVKLDSLLPFSVGKRVCMGESLARMELFLIITSLLAKYTFSPVDPNNLPSLDPVFGFTLAPKRFKLLINTNK